MITPYRPDPADVLTSACPECQALAGAPCNPPGPVDGLCEARWDAYMLAHVAELPKAKPKPRTRQEVVTNLATLARLQEIPDVTRQSNLGVATAMVHLTNLASKNGTTWTQIAEAHGHTDAKYAKWAHKRMESEVRRALFLRQSMN